jgi:Protein of unknown function (DUF2950)
VTHARIRPRRFETAGAGLLLLAAMALVLPARVGAQQPQPAGPKAFESARKAVDALVAANKGDDVAALNEILGPDASNLISSGDDTQDKNDRAHFVELYETHHRLISDGPGKLTLLVGKNEWPMPIPLQKSGDGWKFDSPDAVQELIYRRIGANELAAIKVCRALYQAQLDYAAAGHDGNPPGVYAQRFRSEQGKQNGLYWEVAEGEPQSPAGPLVADADAEGYEQGTRHPFHGYYFRILKAQGPHARGGAEDYIVDGKMTGGFAILAYPAEWDASGVMTFLVSPHGTVFQKSLGDSTADAAKAIKAFDPDPSWEKLPTPK